MPTFASILASFFLAFGAALPAGATADSDAPDVRDRGTAFKDAASYRQVLEIWRSPEDVNAWIAARFDYDTERALLLSETQRQSGASPAIHAPDAFFAAPLGVCVDLSRFGVETLQAISPHLKARYLMIEFDPASIKGNVLRRHWVASFEREGRLYFFADSRRPGHIAGPYDSVQDFIQDYSRYRGRTIVASREVETYKRRAKALAAKQR